MLNFKKVKVLNYGLVEVMILRPGGNDTAIVNGLVNKKTDKNLINKEIMSMFPNVEQVGFVNLKKDKYKLQMAGGEFCGNATRCAAYLACDGKTGEIKIKVSGTNKILNAGIDKQQEVYAQMPISIDTRIQKDQAKPNNSIVFIDGIVQYVDWDYKKIENKSKVEVTKIALKIIKSKRFDKYPAAGVMFVKKIKDTFKIIPIVYVKKINTSFYETACGSGSAAIGLVVATEKKTSIDNLRILQPSQSYITVSVNYEDGKFGDVYIKGKVKPLKILSPV